MSELAKELRRKAGIPDPVEPPLKLAPPQVETEPLRYDITRGAFANPLLKKILATFGNRAFARSSACMEFERFLVRMGASGGTCLEIGTYQGITAVLLTQFFERVVCVSIDEDPRRLIKEDIVHYLGLADRIEFHDVRGIAQKQKLIEGLSFDFAYMDGDHVHDTYSDFELVRRCGRVLFHEAWPLQPPVWNLVHSLPPEEVTWAMHDCFAYWERPEPHEATPAMRAAA